MHDEAHIRIADYPLLRAVAWSTDDQAYLTSQEALSMYKRGWRHIEHEVMDPHERQLLEYLIKTVGGGAFLG